jgi:membrane protein implicated in regulation of membrane protease activity
MQVEPADARRRWFGAFFLMVSAGMLIWGQTFLKPLLDGLVFVVYWLACLGFTGLAMLTALLDVRAVRRRARDHQRDLLQRIIDGRDSGKETRGGKRGGG